MFEQYQTLSPEEIAYISTRYLETCRILKPNGYIQELVSHIEWESAVLGHSLGKVRCDEFAGLLVVADLQLIHAITLFRDLSEIHSRVENDKHTRNTVSRLLRIIRDNLEQDQSFSTRSQMLRSAESLIEAVDKASRDSAIEQTLDYPGLIPIFADLKSKYCVLKGMARVEEEISDELPPPSVASRRLLTLLKDLHHHVAGYSRLGNPEYQKVLISFEDTLEEIATNPFELQAS